MFAAVAAAVGEEFIPVLLFVVEGPKVRVLLDILLTRPQVKYGAGVIGHEVPFNCLVVVSVTYEVSAYVFI